MDEVVAVEAWFGAREPARAAIDRLSRDGVDGSRMHAVDPVEPVGVQGQRDTDRATMGVLGRRVLAGIAWGVGIGTVFGALLIGLAADAGVLGWVAGGGGGALGGFFTGALAGAMTVPTMSPAWQAVSAQAPDEPVRLLVVTHGDHERVAARLGAAGAREVREVHDPRALP